VCPYLGVALTLENACIDHRLPMSRFPELAQEITNLEWVSRRANLMKGDLTPDEFRDLCRLVAHPIPPEFLLYSG